MCTLFTFFSLVLRWPLSIRRIAARVYHIGGCKNSTQIGLVVLIDLTLLASTLWLCNLRNRLVNCIHCASNDRTYARRKSGSSLQCMRRTLDSCVFSARLRPWLSRTSFSRFFWVLSPSHIQDSEQFRMTVLNGHIVSLDGLPSCTFSSVFAKG